MKRTFESFPNENICPICGTSEDKECTLVPIAGTQNGYNWQAQPIHVDCIHNAEFFYHKDQGALVILCKRE